MRSQFYHLPCVFGWKWKWKWCAIVHGSFAFHCSLFSFEKPRNKKYTHTKSIGIHHWPNGWATLPVFGWSSVRFCCTILNAECICIRNIFKGPAKSIPNRKDPPWLLIHLLNGKSVYILFAATEKFRIFKFTINNQRFYFIIYCCCCCVYPDEWCTQLLLHSTLHYSEAVNIGQQKRIRFSMSFSSFLFVW